MFELYQIVDLGILPSFFEQCSYVAIEMMMFGLPFVAYTMQGGLKDMFQYKGLEEYVINELSVLFMYNKINQKLSHNNNHNSFRNTFMLNCQKAALLAQLLWGSI